MEVAYVVVGKPLAGLLPPTQQGALREKTVIGGGLAVFER